MLMGVTRRDEHDGAERDQHREPPTTTGTPAATTLPNTNSNASAASGRLMSSLRWRSASDTVWMSP